MMPIGSEVSNIGDQSVVRNGRAMALAMALGSVAVALSPSASFAQAGVAPPSVAWLGRLSGLVLLLLLALPGSYFSSQGM